MVRVGLWGAFDADDVGEMLLPRIARRELQTRLPGATVRVWTSGDRRRPIRFDDPSDEPPMPLGGWGSSRSDELAVASDLLIVAGTLTPDRPFVVEGVGPIHEPEVPTAWHAVRLRDEPDARFAEQLRDVLERRAYVSAADERTAAVLRGLVDREVVVVPGHALLADRLFRADEPEERTARMRAAGVLPHGDVLVVQGDESLVPDAEVVAAQVRAVCAARGLVPLLVAATPGDGGFADAMSELIPEAWALPETTGLEDLCATVAWCGGVVGGSVELALVATAFGRPALVVGGEPGPDLPRVAPSAIADTFEGGGPIAGGRVGELRARLDGHFDRIAALATQVVAVDPRERSFRSLAARLAEHEAASAERERELEAMISQLSRRLTESDIRFTTLWRKIREGDKHYNWQFNRAEAAEAHVAQLRQEVAWLRQHQRGVSWARRAYLAARQLGGRVLRRVGLRPPLPTPPADPPPEA